MGATGSIHETFTVTLSAATQVAVSLHYATANVTATAGTDYTATSGTLTIAAGATTGTIAVPVLAEPATGASKTLTLTLSSPTNATLSVTAATGTIVTPAAAASISIASASITDVTTGTTTLKFTLTRTGSTTGTSSVLVTAVAGTALPTTDYVFSPTTVTFGVGVATQTVSVTLEGHNDYFTPRNFSMVLSSPTGATIGTGTATGTINSAIPQPVVNIGAVTVAAPISGTTMVMVPLTLSEPDAASVTVNFATSDNTAKAGLDYVATSGTVTFTANQTTAFIPVTINKSTNASNLTFYVTISGTPTGGATLGTKTSTVTIQPVGSAYLGPDPLNTKLTALFVTGTATGDIIGVTAGATAGSLVVTINGINYGSFTPTGHLYVTAAGGSETIKIDPSVNTAAFLYGGAGNDSITAGGGSTVAEGGAGNDSLTAGSGRDILIGGAGSDSLVGGSNQDILIGGSTAYDGNLFALNNLISEWARTDESFLTRVVNIAIGAGLADGDYLNLLTVASNPATPDVLTGGTGSDLAFYDLFCADQLKNFNASDVLLPVL